MAIGLENYPNIEGPDSDYPSGRIKDNPGDGTGTPVNQLTNGDIQEFFAKLMRIAGITPSGIPDNEYSGHQYIEALENFVSPPRVWHEVGDVGEPAFGTGFSNLSPVDPVRFSIQRNSVRILGGVARLAIVPSPTIFILPLAYRPNGEIHCPLNYFEESGNPYAAHLNIKPNGEVWLIVSGSPGIVDGLCYLNGEFIIDSI